MEKRGKVFWRLSWMVVLLAAMASGCAHKKPVAKANDEILIDSDFLADEEEDMAIKLKDGE